MALAVDATAAAASHTAGATSLSSTNLTVGAGATCLLVALILSGELAVASGITVHWDSTGTNQLMTAIASQQSLPNVNVDVHLYGLVNPTAGAKTLSATWTSSVAAVMDSISFSGGVTTSVATAFLRSATNQGASGAPTLALTGATGNISACALGIVTASITSLTTTGSTSWFIDNSQSVSALFTAGSRAPSATSVTWTGAPTSTEWSIVGCDVAAASGTTWSGEGDTDGAGTIATAVIARLLGQTIRW